MITTKSEHKTREFIDHVITEIKCDCCGNEIRENEPFFKVDSTVCEEGDEYLYVPDVEEVCAECALSLVERRMKLLAEGMTVDIKIKNAVWKNGCTRI